MTIYLYKKTHNQTGLQYLGKTKQDPYKYKGSGRYWKEHLNIYGNDVTTEILRECSTNHETQFWGRYYSQLWNIVNDDKWANIIPESGGGPGFLSGINHPNFGKSQSQETIAARANKMRGKKCPSRGNSGPKNGFFGKTHSEENKSKVSEIAKQRLGEKNGMFGRRHSTETRHLMSANHADFSGEKHPCFGRKVSAEEIARRSKTRAKNRLLKKSKDI